MKGLSCGLDDDHDDGHDDDHDDDHQDDQGHPPNTGGETWTSRRNCEVI